MAVRDLAVILISLILAAGSLRPGAEVVTYLFGGIAAIVLAFAVVNMILNVLKVKGKAFYYANCGVELAIGILSLALFPPFGLILIPASLVVIVALHEKGVRKPGELPPPPLTRNYRLTVGAAVLALLAGMLLPAVGGSSFSFMALFLRIGGVSSGEGIPAIGVGPSGVALALLALILLPLSLATGIAGIFRRRFALLSGVFAVAAAVGWISAISFFTDPPTGVGVAAFALIVGGALALAGYIMMRLKRSRQ